MIEVTNLVKRYGNNTVLNQATFQIQDGQLTTIPGPSGCGKSTMLHCMNRLERFDRGRLRIGDVEVVGTEEKQLTAAEEKQLTKRLRDRVGIVFQNFNLFPHLTVLANCTQAPTIVKKLDRAETREPLRGAAHHLARGRRLLFVADFSTDARGRVSRAALAAGYARVEEYSGETKTR